MCPLLLNPLVGLRLPCALRSGVDGFAYPKPKLKVLRPPYPLCPSGQHEVVRRPGKIQLLEPDNLRIAKFLLIVQSGILEFCLFQKVDQDQSHRCRAPAENWNSSGIQSDGLSSRGLVGLDGGSSVGECQQQGQVTLDDHAAGCGYTALMMLGPLYASEALIQALVKSRWEQC